MSGLLDLIGRYGYLVVFFGMMIESAGVPLPGETILIASGVLVHRGVLDFGDAVVFGALGAVIGDQLFLLGRSLRRPGVRAALGRYLLITPERLAHAETFFDRHGGGPSSWPASSRVCGSSELWWLARAACPGESSPSKTPSALHSGRRRPSPWATSCGPA